MFHKSTSCYCTLHTYVCVCVYMLFRRFQLNLQSGPGRFEDVLFHLSAWFDEMKKLVQKTRIDENWINEMELDIGNMFSPGDDIHICILVDQDNYRWQINNGPATVLQNILSPSDSQTFIIDGDLALKKLCINSPTVSRPTVNIYIGRLGGC